MCPIPVEVTWNPISKPRLWRIWLVILGGGFAVLQAPMFDGLAFAPVNHKRVYRIMQANTARRTWSRC